MAPVSRKWLPPIHLICCTVPLILPAMPAVSEDAPYNGPRRAALAAAEAIEHAALKTGEAIQKAARKTGDGLGQAADRTGHALQQAGHGIQKLFDSDANQP